MVVGALGTVKKGMVENIEKVSERANMTEIQKICMLGSARILRKVLSVWTEWLTWVTDVLGAWFAPGWCTKRTPAKTVKRDNNNNNNNNNKLNTETFFDLEEYQLEDISFYTTKPSKKRSSKKKHTRLPHVSIFCKYNDLDGYQKHWSTQFLI